MNAKNALTSKVNISSYIFEVVIFLLFFVLFGGTPKAFSQINDVYLNHLQAVELKTVSITPPTNTKSEDTLLLVPNVFTPNGDNINDIFRPVISDALDNQQAVISRLGSYNLSVFDRTGVPVFQGQGGWDGQGAAIGVYFYVLTFDRSDRKIQRTGTVALLR